MHYKEKRGIAIACLSVRLSITLVDQDHRLEILETNIIARTISQPSLSVAHSLSTYSQGNVGKCGKTKGVGKSGMLEHKSDNICETRIGRGKVTMDCL